MTIASPADLLNWLEQTQFLSPAQAQELRPLLGNYAGKHALATELIRRDWLTPFQVNQILQGRHDQLVLESYRLRERIGEGAMGQIFKAWQPRLNRVVAVKTILKDLADSPRAKERFRREMETAAQLQHPNIARVYDAGEVEGRSYLVMEFVDGFNLSSRIKQQGALPVCEAVEYARQTALGLQHAYERGIVHRDIKPGNLLVTSNRLNEGAPLVKILDFGLARFGSEVDNPERLTEVGKLLGTIDYVSPEQTYDARGADIRADIYSLGCTLFYLLTGRPAFLGENMMEKLSQRLTGEPPWIRALRPEVSPGLEEVLRKMLARRPADRYQTPMEVAEALARYVAPIALALPISAPADAPVVMALPLPTPAQRDKIPMATPIAPSPPTAANPPSEGDFLGMTATGRDTTGEPGQPRPTSVRAKPPFAVKKTVLLGGGLLFLVLGSCACLVSFFLSGPKPVERKGVVRITEAKWSTGDEKAVPGRHHSVLVRIDRVDCKGPVTVRLKDLPPGVTSHELILPPNTNRGECRFTVSFGTLPITKQIRVHAESETDRAAADFPLTLTVKEDPLKKK